MDNRQCYKCGQRKDGAEFNRDKSRKSGMTYICKACASINIKKWQQNNVEYRKRYQDTRLNEIAYASQKCKAKRRDIEFKLSFEEWIGWWGEDIILRGRARDALQMCRYGDIGPYQLGNIYKGTLSENVSKPKLKEDLTSTQLI